jgi:hypothetical protein
MACLTSVSSAIPASSKSGWNLSHSAQKRRHRQALNEDRKRNDGEADGDDLLAQRELGRKSKGQGNPPNTLLLKTLAWSTTVGCTLNGGSKDPASR